MGGDLKRTYFYAALMLASGIVGIWYPPARFSSCFFAGVWFGLP